MSESNFSRELQKLRDAEPESIGPEVSQKFRASIDDLSRSGITDRSIKIGDSAPDFTLDTQSGNPVRLKDCLLQGPIVLSFYRGGWCPYCSVEMQALQSALSQVKDLGAQILAISPQNAEHAARMADQARTDL